MKKQEEIESSEHFMEVYDQICAKTIDPEVEVRSDHWATVFKTIIYYPGSSTLMVGWEEKLMDWQEKRFNLDESKECALFYAKIV